MFSETFDLSIIKNKVCFLAALLPHQSTRCSVGFSLVPAVTLTACY